MAKKLRVLGISAYYHDAAAALVEEGVLVAAAQEERFSRKKHDPAFPLRAAAYCLEEAGISINEIDAVAFYDKPLLKFERLLETYYGFAPRGLRSFYQAMPIWMREKLFLKRELRQQFQELGLVKKKRVPLLFPEHHLSHAASAYFASPFDEAVILTMDGVGEWATASISLAEGKDIKILKELHFPHSLGLVYSAFTYFLGFRVNNGEYKLMGLAPYGLAESEQVDHYKKLIMNNLVRIQPDGSLWLNQSYFRYATRLRMIATQKWEKLFGMKRRQEESAIEQTHCDLALAIQQVTEQVILQMAAEAKRLTQTKHLCLAGGVALNCVANGKLLASQLFEQIYIQPAAGDAGGAAGAALAAYHIHYERDKPPAQTAMPHAYLGPAFGEKACRQALRNHEGSVTHCASDQQLSQNVAQLLADSKIIGWFQGRMEYGPRALGHRSILADPRDRDMQRTLNLKIKYRESFRPFAPIILQERVHDYFDLPADHSPYMLLVAPVKSYSKHNNKEASSLSARIQSVHSAIPAVTHVDGSARIQTVSPSDNALMHQLLKAFEKLTHCPVLVNTSFNVRGEPIVCKPEEAYHCFMHTEMDVLVLGRYIVMKS